MAKPIITLLTDFGLSDHYVGCMKGVILGIHPDVEIVDITHEVKPHDIHEGAFLLRSCYRYFPPRTIHVAIVDPSVGPHRRPIIATVGEHIYLAPDNGILSYIYEEGEVSQVIHVTASHYFLPTISHTFHGRDLFAPVAAWISRGIELEKFGDPVTDFTRFQMPRIKQVNPKILQGNVLHVDKFGNLITNFTEKEIPRGESGETALAKVLVARREVTSVRTSYADGSPGEIFVVLGSTGFYEIVMNKSSAAERLAVGRGAEVGAVLK